METQESKKKQGAPGNIGRPSKDTLNLIIAVCAVLISAASFVATYVQSAAALQEVKAETWPFLQIVNGNYDSDRQENNIYYYLENAGVGPAHVKQFTLSYDGQPVSSLYRFISACCADEVKTLSADFGNERDVLIALQSITDTPAPSLLPAGGRALAFSVRRQRETELIWQALDKARRKLSAYACYCSLLEDCYETNFEGDPVEVDECRREDELQFNG